MQMIAFKVQNPLTKPQFALAVSGGQGIGKSTFFSEVLRAVLGASVKTTSMEAVFDERYTFSSIMGASLLIVEEADEITNFTLSKQLHREKQLDVNVKYGGKGLQWSFGIPIYLTNKAEPKLNEPGAIDRTLYIIRAPTQYSLNLSSEEWLAFQKAAHGRDRRGAREAEGPGLPPCVAPDLSGVPGHPDRAARHGGER